MTWHKTFWPRVLYGLALCGALLAPLAGCNNQSYSSGDRVLVTKFAYDAGLGEPERFDVVVFKYPRGPVENGVPKNYIKRLLGLPGQLLAIFFGQLFFFEPAPGEPPLYEDSLLPGIDPANLWDRPYMHQDDDRSLQLFQEAGKFQIVRKPPEVILALRRIVYDNDFPAEDLVNVLPPRWQTPANGGWTTEQGNAFAHTGASKDVEWLRYQHITRPLREQKQIFAERKAELINDFMDYNAGIKDDHPDFARPDFVGANWVGDLMLDCRLTVQKAEGEFWLELNKGIHRFRARFDLSSGTCTLFKITTDADGKQELKQEELGSAPTRIKAPGNYHVQLANFDARLTLWVNHDLPFGNGQDYPPPELRNAGEHALDPDALTQRRLPTPNDLEPASLGSRAAQIKINHLRLWRDTYYTLSGQIADIDINPRQWGEPQAWKSLRPRSPTTMYVQPGHYLCLGDNSPASSDSREWGVVPKRLLLGRAMLVYFPLNRAGPIR